MLKAILGEGYKYAEAVDGAQALRMLQQDMNIDLVLLDINMPKIDGFAVLEHMNQFRWIDEIPVIAVMACFAEGTTIIKDAQELKVKESDRIAVVTENLKAMGADIEATDDGMIIRGGKPLHGALIQTHMDHRIAMSFAVAGMNADGETTFSDASCVDISYPGFFQDMLGLAE